MLERVLHPPVCHPAILDRGGRRDVVRGPSLDHGPGHAPVCDSRSDAATCAAGAPLSPELKEAQRLVALDRFDVLDTPEEESFERITRLTRHVLGVPMSTISLLDGHRQWFKSHQGLEARELARGPALCDVAIRQAEPLVVADTLADPRFRDNPFVAGEPRLRFYAGAQLRTAEGCALGTLCAMDTVPHAVDPAQIALLTDLAGIVMSELELRFLAGADSLTGAMSRRAFRDAAGRAIELALRHGQPLSCLVFDLDHFKAVNDGHGHATGDLVLRETVAACLARLRKSDPLGRMGGEEFAVLLPQTGLEGALKVAENLRSAIAALRLGEPDDPLQVTASFGVASLDGAVDLDALLARADAALYAAKADGRNRCHAWRPLSPGGPPDLRRRVLKAGRLTFDSGPSTIDCTVKALSDASATLRVMATAGIPDEFELQIEADGLSRLCRVTERHAREIEVAFA